MEDRKAYICYGCKNADSPCIAVTEGDLELKCLHGVNDPEWREMDPVLAAGALSELADEQRGRTE